MRGLHYAAADTRNKEISAPASRTEPSALQSNCDVVVPGSGARGMVAVRHCEPGRDALCDCMEDRVSMVRPIVEGVPLGVVKARRDRGDVAMNVLQYGTAIISFAVVTLLAVVR